MSMRANILLFFSYEISFSTQIFFPTLCAQTFALFLLQNFFFHSNFFSYIMRANICFFFSYKISFPTQISFSYIAILCFTSLPLLPSISLLNESFCSFFLLRNFFFHTNFFFLHCHGVLVYCFYRQCLY